MLLTDPAHYHDARLKLMVLSPRYWLLIPHYPWFISSPPSFFPVPGSPTAPHTVQILLPECLLAVTVPTLLMLKESGRLEKPRGAVPNPCPLESGDG